ncbi:hypothetical protein Golob_025935 [Gossypium lobatum]|uniref:Uncharacterized protein n=1 Tax=Gossypium lobatum TaxID=34289 RepID=A0A7J8LTJ6_9ROSI|nr:hypothetical protein [Gossypium lobatum]
MMVAESLMELVSRRNKFESFKPNRRGNGWYYEEYQEGYNDYGNTNSSDSGNEKPRNGKWRPNSSNEKRGKLRCYLCKGPHMKRDSLKVSSVSTIKRNDELEEKRNGVEGLMFVDINIAGQKRSTLVDTGASDLFILEKAEGKLGLSIKKSIGKLKR